MQAYESDTHEKTLAEIRQHFGFVPAFFAPAQETPGILQQLWQHMQLAYIRNPLPILFKEQLFTYFSRYCHVPYALICHSCMLYSLGTNPQEVLALLEMPTPTVAEIDDYLTLLTSEPAPFTDWPPADTPLGKAVFFCSIFILLKPDLEQSDRCCQQLRRLLGIGNYNYLTLFFSFMKTCQTWIETHSEILPDGDEHIQAQYATLLAEEPRLLTFFQSYYQQIGRERQTLSEQLAEKLRESQQLEEALRTAAQESSERTNKLEAIIEAMADGLMILDSEGRVVEANAVSRNVFSVDKTTYTPLPLRELTKQVHFDLCDENGHPLPYEQWPAYRALKGERLTGANTMDLMVCTNSGDQILLNISAVPVYDPQGNISGAITISRDVTERRQLERRMREMLDALLTMAEMVVQVPVHTQNDDEPATPWVASPPDQQLVGLICRILSCRRMGVVMVDPLSDMLQPVAATWSSAELKQQWWADMEHSRLHDYFPPHVIARFHADKVFIFDASKHHPSGSAPYDFQTFLFVPMLVREQLVGILGLEPHQAGHWYTPEEIALAKTVAKLVALVIERERLVHERAVAQAGELSMRETNRRMDEFLSMASHELKTPLTSIITNIQLAKRRLHKLCRQQKVAVQDLDAKIGAVQELLSSADQQVWRLNRLVDELLDVSRIQANKLELRTARHNLRTIVREAIEQQRQITPERRITLQLPSQDVSVNVDADRIGQVIMNYASNALKYSDCSQSVEVSMQVDAEEHMARVCVHDHGPGLPLAEQTRIWDRFYRVKTIEVQSGNSIGLGLGLHICKRIIERHGGQVGVTSLPGQGSTFWFALPLAE